MVDKYKVADIYDNWVDVLGTTNNLNSAKKMMRERLEDTDGECCVVVFNRDENNPEKFSKDWRML